MDSTTSMYNNTTTTTTINNSNDNYNNTNNINGQRGMKRKRIASCILSSSTSVSKSSSTQQKKNVRFMEYPTIQYTYSADEYDRGGLFDHAVLYKFNAPILPSSPSPSSNTTTTSHIPLIDTPSVPSQIYQQPTLTTLTTTKPKLSVNIPSFSFVHNDDDQDSATSTEPSPDTPNDNDITSLCTPPTTISGATVRSTTKQDRPKLSVDTSICAGPLFFTKLSTNHRSKTSDDDNNSSNFLVPMSALPV